MGIRSRAGARAALLVFASLFAAASLAQAKYASDDNKIDGDHLRFRAALRGFMRADGSVKTPFCAPSDSALAVKGEDPDDKTKLVVRFYYVGKAEDGCGKDPVVDKDTVYEVDQKSLDRADFRRTGVTFGGLVVPFKFRLGGDRGISSSATVAPYVGFRTGFGQSYGLTFTPIVSAGLGLVPVTNPSTSKTDTKSAFSLATGFVMGSSKNEKFNAGLIVGRDLLSKSDRLLDPNADKWWLSFYLGVSL